MPRNESNQTAPIALGAILQSRYRILRQLGKGGMATVFEAVDLRLGHSVAIKQTMTADPELWAQFEREARLMAGLNHPALPRVSDYFTEGNCAFLVMQYVDGVGLAEILVQQPGPVPTHSVVAWADQLLDALIYLHSHDRQVVHRDIKPHNLKINAAGRIILLDFGLAKAGGMNHEEKDSGRSIFGYSPRYAPLEQIQDLGTTPQSDIYALGATLYHLLTGVKPPDALARAAAVIGGQTDPLRPAHELNSVVAHELSAILQCAMAQNPNQRYRSAFDFREALRRVGRIELDSDVELIPHCGEIEASVVGPVETTPVGAIQVAVRSRISSRALITGCAAVLLMFGLFCRFYPWKLPLAANGENRVAVERVRASSLDKMVHPARLERATP